MCEFSGLPPGITPETPLKKCFTIFFFASLLYLATLKFVEDTALVNLKARCPKLYDFGWNLIPGAPSRWLDYVCFGCIGFLLYMVFWEEGGHPDVARWVLMWVTFGGVFSATLHSCTIVGDVSWANDAAGKNSMFTGGFCDRLMSNHTFNMGITVAAITLHYGLPEWLPPAFVFVFSVAMLASRQHYTVDIVLAWWVLGAVRWHCTNVCNNQ
jgi:hypothetical protein